LLELGPVWRERYVEAGELTVEVGVELGGGRLERLDLTATRVRLAELFIVRTVPLKVHVEAHDRPPFGDQGQSSDDAVDHGMGAHQAASSSGMRLIGWSPVAQRYCTA
jgi:hypothetical protein